VRNGRSKVVPTLRSCGEKHQQRITYSYLEGIDEPHGSLSGLAAFDLYGKAKDYIYVQSVTQFTSTGVCSTGAAILEVTGRHPCIA